jgi:hypothetical protein
MGIIIIILGWIFLMIIIIIIISIMLMVLFNNIQIVESMFEYRKLRTLIYNDIEIAREMLLISENKQLNYFQRKLLKHAKNKIQISTKIL